MSRFAKAVLVISFLNSVIYAQDIYAQDNAEQAVMKSLNQLNINKDVLAGISAIVETSGQSRWSGEVGDYVFGIAARRLTKGELPNRIRLIEVDTALAFAINEMVLSKATAVYLSHGMTDKSALVLAVKRSDSVIRSVGRVEAGATYSSKPVDEFAVGVVVAKNVGVKARLLNQSNLEIVKRRYADEMAERQRGFIDNQQWADAMAIFHHLKKSNLHNCEITVGAAICKKELGQEEKALALLQNAHNKFGETASIEMLELIGDTALSLDNDGARELAEEVFKQAIRYFQKRNKF